MKSTTGRCDLLPLTWNDVRQAGSACQWARQYMVGKLGIFDAFSTMLKFLVWETIGPFGTNDARMESIFGMGPLAVSTNQKPVFQGPI